jgi:carbamoyltransferase
MKILGLSAFYHDSAAALVSDGEIVAAAQEERFTRRKHDPRFPSRAVAYCLEEARVELSDLDYVVFYDKPLLKFSRLLETYLTFAPRGWKSFRKALPLWVREKLFQRELVAKELRKFGGGFDTQQRLLFTEHHVSHAASAFYPSPFREAIVLTMDGVGEWATTSVAVGRDNKLEIIKELRFPHSLGLLYSAFTYYTGFGVNSGEYQLMGLAPYGEPKYCDKILDHLVQLKPDGSFHLNLDYFDYCTGLRMTNAKFDQLFGQPARAAEGLITQFHMDMAASIQEVLNEIVVRMTRSLARETSIRNLCLAGGVALNCVTNGKLLRDGAFERIWIQPASGDAGGALGAALAAYYMFLGNPREPVEGDSMQGAYLGPGYAQAEIQERLRAAGARFSVMAEAKMIRESADALVAGKAVGWFQGRMEFGPRALGARSILGDPRSPRMQALLNLKIKYRESFRPFALSVLREHVAEWFEMDADSPYMLLVADVANSRRRAVPVEESALFGIDKLNVPRSEIPAVTHVDYSARIQTVHRETNPVYHRLLTEFHRRTGCPVIVNTSFNVRGEPIVCTPEDAFRCFMGTEIEVLAAGNCLVRKEEQNMTLQRSCKDAFALD